MCLIFWGIFSGLFVVLLITYIFLLIFRKVEKDDAIKFLLVVLLPILIISVVLLPFAYRDLATGNYPKPPEKPKLKEFYGAYYNDEGREVKTKLFEYSVYLNDYSIYPAIQFGVDSNTEFENYLKTLECYKDSIVNDEGDTVITLSKVGEEWKLIRYQDSNRYKWYNYCIGSEVYKTNFNVRGIDGKMYNLFRYEVNSYEEGGSGANRFIAFGVDDKEKFEEYLTTVESYAGTGSTENVEKYFQFVKDDNIWTIDYYAFPNTYCLYIEARNVEDIENVA